LAQPSQEQSVVGETPNFAARLQALAQPGTLVIADSTRRQIGALFEIEDLGLRSLAGFAEPQRAWRIDVPPMDVKVISTDNKPPGSAKLACPSGARSELADKYAADVMEYIAAARKAGCESNGDIARALTARGIETPSGGREWSRAQVARILARAAVSPGG
jgi:hypothetical protein